MRVSASRLRWSVSGRVWRYFWVVWIWEWPMRSITDLRSAPPASSQEAWAWRRSWTRTAKPMPLALTAGSQMRVRKVLREIGVPALVANSRSSRPMPVGADVFGDGVEPFLADAEGAGLVVLRVGLGQVAMAGGGVLLGDLDDGLLDSDGAAEEVDVPGFEGDQLAPPEAGLDQGLRPSAGAARGVQPGGGRTRRG